MKGRDGHASAEQPRDASITACSPPRSAHSAFLLGGALGLMGPSPSPLLLLTARPRQMTVTEARQPRARPVLLARTLALLGPGASTHRRGRASTPPSASAGTARPCSRGSAPCGSSGWTATRRRWSSPPSGWRRTATGPPSCTRSTTSSPQVLSRLGVGRVQGVLFDLGVSSHAARRGAPAASPTPRTRRWTCGWTRAAGVTAADVVNTYPARPSWPGCCREYGEERFARRIADAVVRERASASRSPAPRGWPSWSAPRSRQRPGAPAATRPSAPSRRCGSRSTASWTPWLRRCPRPLDALAVGGRIVVMSYQSLEDRMVKRTLVAGAASTAPPGPAGGAARAPAGAPAADPRRRDGVRRGEVAANPRAASVRLRAAERLRDAA